MNDRLLSSVITLTALLSGCNSANFSQALLNQSANPALSAASPFPAKQTQTAAGEGMHGGSTAPVAYKNTSRNFSFTLPAGWAKMEGDVNSDSVLFMQQPVSNTCSFQIHITRMQTNFPAEASVKASLKSAKQDIKIGKLLSAKRRDESGKEHGKKVRFTRGWEIVENGQPGGYQRIIYQAYDRQNYYLNMLGAASTERFAACRPALRQIINSIKFGA
ncbi:MAG: hypothetical protein ACU837_04065 [Gammaproteobacteria bacterium]